MESIDPISLALIALFGLMMGIVTGVTGMVFSSLRVPVIYLLVGNIYIAAGTNLAVTVITTQTASLNHIRLGNVKYGVFLALGVSAWLGGFLGGYLSIWLPAALLLLACSMASFFIGGRMIFMGRRPGEADGAGDAPIATGPAFWARTSALGTFIGVLGGAVGLLMGGLRIPLMIQGLRMSPLQAGATNLAIATVTSLLGFTGHALHGNFSVPVILAMGGGSVGGALIGSRLSGRISPRKLFGWMGAGLITAGGLMLRNALAGF